jgi:hypothetical protein
MHVWLIEGTFGKRTIVPPKKVTSDEGRRRENRLREDSAGIL